MSIPCRRCRTIVLGDGCPSCQPTEREIQQLKDQVTCLGLNLRCIQGMNDVEKIHSYIATILGDKRNG